MSDRLWMLLLITSAFAVPVSGQVPRPEMWPYPHPVYSWLERAYGRGLLLERGWDGIPASRAVLLDRLLRVDTTRLDAEDRTRWWSWVRELEDRPDQEAFLLPRSRGQQGHLYAYRDPETRLFVDPSVGGELMSVRETEGFFGPVSRLGGRLYGSVLGRVGFFLDARAIGYRPPDLGRFDPIWSRTQNVRIREEGSYDVQAFMSYLSGPLMLDMGRGRILYGIEPASSLIWSENPPYVPYLRFSLRYRRTNFQFLHAALQDSVFKTPLPDRPQQTGTWRRPRWLALHRVQFEPRAGWTVAFTEMVVYGNRGMELTYWIPIYPFLISEDEFGFLDNILWTLEARVRIRPGWILHGSWLIDNLTFSGLFTDTLDNKHGLQAGIHWYGPRGWEAGLSYTYIDPFVYSHPRPYNAYIEREWTIGHPLGPNADSWLLRLRRWVGARSWIEAELEAVRKGLNVLDTSGNLVRNVGGDARLGHPLLGGVSKRFLTGSDRHRWVRGALMLRWEPWRAFVFWVRFELRRVLEGARIPDQRIWRLGLEWGR